MNAIRCDGLPMGKKWRAIQQSEEDSICPACNAEEETAEHFLTCQVERNATELKRWNNVSKVVNELEIMESKSKLETWK
ncbi:hypothetical protein QOT17_018310 [Balamuthia mandrillaris]